MLGSCPQDSRQLRRCCTDMVLVQHLRSCYTLLHLTPARSLRSLMPGLSIFIVSDDLRFSLSIIIPINMSKVIAFYHLVINTKGRQPTIPLQHKRLLYAYIHGIITNKKCKTTRINGIDNHLHLLFELHPTVALADLVGDIKRSSTLWLRNKPEFPDFECWGKEYFACTVSFQDVEAVKKYIINQEEHHKKNNFEEEMKEWASTMNVYWDDNLLS